MTTTQIVYQTEDDDHNQKTAYGREISDYIDWYINALIDGDAYLASLYRRKIEMYI